MTHLGASSTLRHTIWVLRGNPVTAIAAAGTLALALVAFVGPALVAYDPVASDVPLARISHTANCCGTVMGGSGEGDEEPWR